MTTIVAADLFAGCGGSSTGLSEACAELGLGLDLTAVNHWHTAVETHAQNHPGARHLCETLDSVDPRRLFAGRRLDLLLASPECTNHSRAKGGKPKDDQSRATPWHVVRWAEALRPRAIIVENVMEMESWGPLTVAGKPIARRKGETFGAWVNALRSLNYSVSHRVLRASDHGDATTRERLFVVARRGNHPARWPDASHAKQPAADLFGGGLKRWRAAREIIDWTLKGESIFGRKRPLKPKTLARIEAGLRRFGGLAFSVRFKGTGADQIPSTAGSLGEPLGTICAGGTFGVCEPFVIPYRGERAGQQPRTHAVGEPLPTITTEAGHALVEPFVMHATHHGKRRTHSLGEPLPTVTGANRGELSLVEPFLMQMSQSGSNGDRMRELSRPVPTITTADDLAFVVSYYGTDQGPQDLGQPLDTVTTKDRFALIELCRRNGIDLLFRMLQPHELAAAHSFPAGYRFAGTRTDQVRQIGNSNPVKLARALCRAQLAA